MRIGVILRLVSRLAWLAVFAMTPSLLLSWGSYEEYHVRAAWLVSVGIGTAIAFILSRFSVSSRTQAHSLRRREGLIAVSLGWLVLVTFTAVAFFLSGYFPAFADAFFESMSGFTTTGASVISDIEALPKSILFMRSFSHWVGGMGIIVLSVAILPELAVGGMQLFSAESTGVQADKLAPRITATAKRLWLLYVGITAVQVVFLVPAMSLFDAINHSMATIATGGFSTKNSSIASFGSLYIEMVILAFMWISGLSFTLQYRALIRRRPDGLWNSSEVRLYMFITVLGTFMIAAFLWADNRYDTANCLRHAAFTVVSILTTTGFGTENFDAWPDVCRIVLVALMIIGGCAGSTAGGSKVVRIYIVFKHTVAQLRRTVRPKLIAPINLGRHAIPRETTEAVLGYFVLYTATIAILSVAMTTLGLDIVSGTTAAVSAINSIGPGLGTVGAAQNFAGVPDSGLYLLSFGMLLGRLEIYPLLVLFTWSFWRRG